MSPLNVDSNTPIVPDKRTSSFEVKPLDVSLAQIQYNLINRLEREVPEYGDFAPVTEKYTSKSPRLKIGDIIVKCSNVKDSETKKDRSLDITVFDRHNPDEFCTHNIATGTKKEILEAVNQSGFFETCKSISLQFDEQLKGNN